MRKMKCLFIREFHDDHTATITREVTQGCEWVLDGEGEASAKIDGTACAVIGGKLYARFDCKPSKRARKRHGKGEPWELSEFNTPPDGAIPCQEPDMITGHWPHWVPVANQPEYKYHREAWRWQGGDVDDAIMDGTYELVGPAVNGNPEHLKAHILIRHGLQVVFPERTFDGLKQWLEDHEVEGIVFKRRNGEMCKIRRRDYGLQWPVNHNMEVESEVS